MPCYPNYDESREPSMEYLERVGGMLEKIKELEEVYYPQMYT
jgi:hypothetical protein